MSYKSRSPVTKLQHNSHYSLWAGNCQIILAISATYLMENMFYEMIQSQTKSDNAVLGTRWSYATHCTTVNGVCLLL